MQTIHRSSKRICIMILAVLLIVGCRTPVPSTTERPQTQAEWPEPSAGKPASFLDRMRAIIGLAPENSAWMRSITIADAQDQLRQYELELQELRALYHSHSLPEDEFFLFGMGGRRKMVYREGVLLDSLTGEIIQEWDTTHEVILPPEYLVVLETKSSELVRIFEDKQGVWVEENGRFQRISSGKLNLPRFEESTFPQVLRVLHQEVLINIIDGYPSPNYLVYSKPWYRDAAVMAMVLQKTGNLQLIRNWIEDIRDPFDRNNAGIQEPDNLGQVLYLVSLVSDENHPVVPVIQNAISTFEKDGSIQGLTDFSMHSVYQTLWLKFGLAALSLPDPYQLPDVKDDYASLFWMGFKEQNDAPQLVFESPAYPYLTTAQDHFFGTRNGFISSRNYPLTWESLASAARYEGMAVVSRPYTDAQTASPHGWHAAEWFLLLIQD